MTNLFESILVQAVGISADHPLAPVLSARSEVMQLTQKSHDAALRPEAPGGLSHAERAALACRMARLNNEERLAQHYEAMIPADMGKDGEIRLAPEPAYNKTKLTQIREHSMVICVRH